MTKDTLNQASYNIAFSINRPYLLFMCVTLYSLLKNNQNYYFNIYVLHNDCLNDDDIDKVVKQSPLNEFNNFKIHLVDVSIIEDLKALQEVKKVGFWPQEIYFKIYLPKLLPHVDKILNLDVDLIVHGDIKDLFDIDDEKHLLYGDSVRDEDVNAGILLFNLALMRKLKIMEKIEASYKPDPKKTEELVFEEVAKGKIKFLKNKVYTVTTRYSQPKNKEELSNRLVFHYVSKKPWVTYSLKAKYSWWCAKLYLQYIQAFIDKKYKIRFLFLKYYILSFSLLTDTVHKVIYRNRGIRKKQLFTTNKFYKYSNIKRD